jgi:hypothetical protein
MISKQHKGVRGLHMTILTLALVGMLAAVLGTAALAPAVWAQEGGSHHAGGEANLTLPDLHTVTFAGGLDGHTLLLVPEVRQPPGHPGGTHLLVQVPQGATDHRRVELAQPSTHPVGPPLVQVAALLPGRRDGEVSHLAELLVVISIPAAVVHEPLGGTRLGEGGSGKAHDANNRERQTGRDNATHGWSPRE